jgi:hypothetical protein
MITQHQFFFSPDTICRLFKPKIWGKTISRENSNIFLLMEYFSKKLGKKTRRQKEGKRPMVTVATLL